jgi:hypothetical protein
MATTKQVMELETLQQAQFDRWFDEKFEEKMIEREASHVPSLSIIVTKGTLDMGYPPFILASTAAALGWEVELFFTFYGLQLLKRDLETLAVSPLGNPAMPMKMPSGPSVVSYINRHIQRPTNRPGQGAVCSEWLPPLQKLQRSNGLFVGLPSGETLKRPLLRYVPWKGGSHSLRDVPCIRQFSVSLK